VLPSHRDLALLGQRSRPLSRPDWLFELKWNGYRALALRGDVVRLLSRRGRDMAAEFPDVVAALQALPRDTALDGELVVVGNDGRPLADYLSRGRGSRTAAGGIREAATLRPAAFLAFDILFDAGEDVRNERIEQRKARLVDRLAAGPHLRPVMPLEGEGAWLYTQADALGLEGIVAKRRASMYRAGRTGDWLKLKTPHAIEVQRRRSGRA
jgi:bifunctional non-homologous end joining protein LigD